MTPTQQTVFGDTGNCLQACIASLFDMSIEDVPHFLECPPDKDPAKFSWFRAFELWLNEQGIQPVVKQAGTFCPYDTYYLTWGISPRGIHHSVISKNGNFVFDPHPEGGFVEPHQDVFFYKTFN